MNSVKVKLIDCSKMLEQKQSVSWKDLGVPIKDVEDFFKYIVNETKDYLRYPHIAAWEAANNLVAIYLNTNQWKDFFRLSKVETVITTVRVCQPIMTILKAANQCNIRTTR